RDDLATDTEHRHVDAAAGDEAGHYRGDLPTEPVHAPTLWTGSANVAPFRTRGAGPSCPGGSSLPACAGFQYEADHHQRHAGERRDSRPRIHRKRLAIRVDRPAKAVAGRAVGDQHEASSGEQVVQRPTREEEPEQVEAGEDDRQPEEDPGGRAV